MGLKVDRFTWIVIAVVVALLVGAVITVNVTGGQGWESVEYLEEDSPATPVHNVFVALQKGDLPKARAQYTERVLKQADVDTAYGPLSSNRFLDNQARRLRIVDVELDEDDPDKAGVTFVVDTYVSDGLFGGGSTWSIRVVVDVVRTEDGWKIDTAEFFY